MAIRITARTAACLASLLFVGVTASAADAPSGGQPSPLLGAWSLDTSRLPMPPDQRPRSVRFSFADAGASRWTIRVDIVYSPGQEVHSIATATLDGTPAPVDSSPEADHVQLRQPVPNVLVMALMKGGVLMSTRVYSASPDGRHLVETAVYPGQNGVAVIKPAYFDRAR
ncbi:hypothetical protein P3W24_13210 [Luteibacter sp. PPL201]|uniref:LuxR family transcriptional regulator n=1 Tax=Luteibacter sahnii TaxID=3021977 RepID=A0ABT6BD30_9GAMM|nr:hypothetical protein [Luteibacter sp. PPL193]MDY1549353.1 hypothetical protein [Luteibacter sp. PPL193]